MKLNFENLYVLAFIAVFLAVGFSAFENQLSHQVPMGYFASDAFFHESETQWMKEKGRILYALPSIVGNHEDAYDLHPPFLFEITSVYSYTSGLEVYDAIYFMTVIMILAAALIMYAIIRNYSKDIAMISIPATLLVFSSPFNQVINFGQWLFVSGVLFLIACFWAISKIELKKMFIILAAFMGAAAIAHQPEFVFAGMFLAAYLSIFLLLRKAEIRHFLAETRKNALPLIIVTAAVILLTFYSLSIFYYGWINKYSPNTEKNYAPVAELQIGFTTDNKVADKGFADITLANLGSSTLIGVALPILIVAGMVLFWLLKNRKGAYPAIIGFFMIIISNLTYIGIGKRAFSHRWFWHFYLAFFLGLAVYHILKFAIRKWDSKYAVATGIILLVIFAQPAYGKTKGTIMDPYNWEGLMWMKANLPQKATVHYFYVGNLIQSPTVYNSERLSYIVDYNKYAQKLQTGAISQNYSFGLTFAFMPLVCPKGAMKFGYYTTYINNASTKCQDYYYEADYPKEEFSLCEIEYYYFDKEPSSNGLVQYNLAIRNELLKSSHIKEIHSNAAVSILKNEKPGENCLAK